MSCILCDTQSSEISFDTAAALLTNTILGYDNRDLEIILSAIALSIQVSHIAYVRLTPDKSPDANLFSAAVATYSKMWQRRYFEKQYALIDPVISHGKNAVLPFDWQEFARDDPVVLEFFSDARRHGVGSDGLSIPVRNRRGHFSIVSFSSSTSKPSWIEYKKINMVSLRILSVLIDTAASINFNTPLEPVRLSKREEQCLIWTARGKTFQDIAEILGISHSSVKCYLDTARHKLNCANLTHAVAVAVASGLIPSRALR